MSIAKQPAPASRDLVKTALRLSDDGLVTAEVATALLHEPYPVLQVNLAGSIVDANRAARWLFQWWIRDRGDLVGQHVGIVFAQAILDGHAPLEDKNRELALRKLVYLSRTLDQPRQDPTYLELKRKIGQKGWGGRTTRNPWYLIVMVDPDGLPETYLQFKTYDIPLGRGDGTIVAFKPADDSTSDALDGLLQRIVTTSDDRERESFGAWLRSARKTKGFSEDKLARQLGVSRSTINHWEHERRSPRDAEQLAELLDALDVRSSERARVWEMAGYDSQPLTVSEGQQNSYLRILQVLDMSNKLAEDINRQQEELAGALAQLGSLVEHMAETGVSFRPEVQTGEPLPQHESSVDAKSIKA